MVYNGEARLNFNFVLILMSFMSSIILLLIILAVINIITMAQTPTSADKRSLYASPIGLLKNYNTINAPSASNTYEE